MGRQKDANYKCPAAEFASLAKNLSHPARVAILLKLASVEGCSCSDFVKELPLAQATVSQHLAVLVRSGFVHLTEQGTMSCYTVNVKMLERLSVVSNDFLSRMKCSGQKNNCCKVGNDLRRLRNEYGTSRHY